MKALRQPPFAKDVVAARRRGASPNIYLMAGDHAWRRAKRRCSTIDLCLPPEEDFAKIDWRCISGLDIVLVTWNRPSEFVDALARHLVVSGVASVAAIGQRIADGDAVETRTVWYKPKSAAGKAA